MGGTYPAGRNKNLKEHLKVRAFRVHSAFIAGAQGGMALDCPTSIGFAHRMPP